MTTFHCKEWLYITISNNSEITLVKIDHCNNHVPYFPINIPPDIEQMVCDNKHLSTDK